MRRDARFATVHWRTQHRESEYVEPVVIHDHYRFGHETLSVPRQSKPVSPVVPFIPMKTDHSNVLIWRFPQSQSPVPFFSALDTLQNLVSVDIEYSICGLQFVR
jgi:hypothetical protein